MSRKTVFWVCMALLFGILGWDLWLYLDDIDGNTISQIIVEWSENILLVPVFIGMFMGVLIGHWWA